ncbi:MAG: 4Fe-4S dicluster domain-containing protein [Anaerolineae bacterium]|nr:4Fe-4S dicluster domain-containing protein [Anaerolineae bacterium]
MGFKIMPKSALVDWVNHLRAGYRVVGPQPRHGQFVFAEITDPADLALDYPTSVLPPKQYLLPPREVLFKFQNKGMQIKANIESVPTVILGVHTCDMHAIKLLDHIHQNGYTDQHYRAHWNNTYLVSVECLKPCMEHSFCKSMGTLSVTEGFDLHLTDLGDAYAVDIGSEKGEALLEGFSAVWGATDEDYERLNKVLTEKWPRFNYRLEFDVTELPDILNISQKSSYWNELGDRCLACGMCTKVCPTCYCFNVSDEVELSLQSGQRIRTWDSCQVEEFALVAGGHNFRSKRALRQRHRFLRKGKYQYEAFGMMGCVGCGRCAQACLVHITPVETFNELYRRSQQAEKTEAKA